MGESRDPKFNIRDDDPDPRGAPLGQGRHAHRLEDPWQGSRSRPGVKNSKKACVHVAYGLSFKGRHASSCGQLRRPRSTSRWACLFNQRAEMGLRERSFKPKERSMVPAAFSSTSSMKVSSDISASFLVAALPGIPISQSGEPLQWM